MDNSCMQGESPPVVTFPAVGGAVGSPPLER